MKSASTQTFRNKARNVVNIPGTKVSVSNAQLHTSTGSSTLDFFLGGGLAIGTICVIEEDRYNSYASLLMKYFLAEGATRKHSIFLAGGDKDPKDFLKELPAVKSVECSSNTKRSVHDPMIIARDLLAQAAGVKLPTIRSVECCSNTKPTIDVPYDPMKTAKDLLAEAAKVESPPVESVPYCSGARSTSDDLLRLAMGLKARAAGIPMGPDLSRECSSNAEPEDELKIAWRYKYQSVEDAIKGESYNMSFDLTKTMPYEEIENLCVSTWIPADASDELHTEFLGVPYFDLLNKIRLEIESQDLKTSATNAETILRVGISSIGSPLWRTGDNDADDLQLVRFLFALKAYLRSSFAVAFITVPAFLTSNHTLSGRIRDMCDTVIALESFVGSDKMSNPLFKDYDGLLHIKNLPVLNTSAYPSMPEDLAFKLKKRGLIIEPLHLPPELGDPTPEQQEQFGCGSGLGKKLDF